VPEPDKEPLLREAVEVVQRGRKNHPGGDRLRDLFVRVQNRRLGHTENRKPPRPVKGGK
jgi:hypothetical protein